MLGGGKQSPLYISGVPGTGKTATVYEVGNPLDFHGLHAHRGIWGPSSIRDGCDLPDWLQVIRRLQNERDQEKLPDFRV